MSTRGLLSPHDQSATFVELFFDLVFVFAITQVVALLHHDLSWTGVGHSILVFWLVWWAWTQFTWALNSADTEHPSIQFGTLVATAIAFFMAIGVAGAFDGGAIWFAGPYVLVRVVGLALYIRVMREDPAGMAGVPAFATLSIGGLAAALIGAFVGPETQWMLWTLVILLDFVAASVGGKGVWGLHPEHFAERHGLIVIIALGESLIAAAGGLVGVERTTDVLIVGFLAVAITCSLWWTYFPVAKPQLENALVQAEEQARSTLARDAFSFGHFPMLCGVIAYAVGIEEAVRHPGDPLPPEARAALALGLLLFVGGLAFALARSSCRVKWTRLWVSIATAAAVFFITPVTAVVSLSVAFGGVAIVAVLEERQAERMREA